MTFSVGQIDQKTRFASRTDAPPTSMDVGFSPALRLKNVAGSVYYVKWQNLNGFQHNSRCHNAQNYFFA